MSIDPLRREEPEFGLNIYVAVGDIRHEARGSFRRFSLPVAWSIFPDRLLIENVTKP